MGKGSDHLQLVKFWPSRAPGKGVCGGAKIFGSALLQPARSVCVSSERFFHLLVCYFPAGRMVAYEGCLEKDWQHNTSISFGYNRHWRQGPRS